MRRILPLFLALALGTASGFAADKKVALLIAGRPSHGPGEHEHNAGVQLLAKCLNEGAADRLEVITKLNADWPTPEELAKADTILIYSDGGGGHPALKDDRLQQLGEQMKRGAGFVCLHYAVEVPKDQAGQQFLNWLGGYFETDWSVNPHWNANFKDLPKHPISNGVQSFGARDEWYYHMRFPEGMEGVTPILSDVPSAETLSRPDGPHSGNPAVRAEVAAGKPQHVAWAADRKDGGRGFGFTGGHFHKGWGNDSQRKLVLNGILWTAKAEVPAEGVQSQVSAEDLAANLDPKGKK